MKRLSIITSHEGHMNRTSSRRAVAGFLLAFTIAGLSGCTGAPSGTCRYRKAVDLSSIFDPNRSRRVSSAAECSRICSDDPRNSGCAFTPQKTAITGP